MEDNNQIELFAIIAGFVTILAGMIFQEKNQNSTLNNFIMTISIILNILFFLKWISLILKM